MKRDNHYVPDSYLKRWGDLQGKVATYRFLVPHQNARVWIPHSPKSIAYHQHLYTRLAVGGETDEIETWFETEFETPAAGAIQRAVADQELSQEDWRQLIRFVAAQDVRTPASLMDRLRHWNEILPNLVNGTLEGAVRKLKAAKRSGVAIPKANVPDDSELFPVRTFIRRPAGDGDAQIHVEATIGRSLWLWSLKRALTSTLNVLHKHHWTILHSPPGIEWLTSDNPVVRLNYRGQENFDFKGGWNSPGTVIFMPLSPTHLIYTQVGGGSPESTSTPFHLAAQIQRYTIEHAHRYVFSRTIDRQVALWRPRIVNSQAFHAEAEQWKAWHSEQSEAERALLQDRGT